MTAARGQVESVIREARELAWWPRGNPSDTTIYRERKAAFLRLQSALQCLRRSPTEPEELVYLIAAARRLAEHNGSNRWGVAYYERKAAFAQLRGCLAIYDRAVGLLS